MIQLDLQWTAQPSVDFENYPMVGSVHFNLYISSIRKVHSSVVCSLEPFSLEVCLAKLAKLIIFCFNQPEDM
jgi:hypothetical protein